METLPHRMEAYIKIGGNGHVRERSAPSTGALSPGSFSLPIQRDPPRQSQRTLRFIPASAIFCISSSRTLRTGAVVS